MAWSTPRLRDRTYWSLPRRSKQRAFHADQYFADRQAHGFNALWIILLCNSYTYCNADGTTFDGIAAVYHPRRSVKPKAAYFEYNGFMLARVGYSAAAQQS
jgi:hypothetical protein